MRKKTNLTNPQNAVVCSKKINGSEITMVDSIAMPHKAA